MAIDVSLKKKVVMNKSTATELYRLSQKRIDLAGDAEGFVGFVSTWLEFASIYVNSKKGQALLLAAAKALNVDRVSRAKENTEAKLDTYIEFMDRNGYKNIEVEMSYDRGAEVVNGVKVEIEIPSNFKVTGVQNANGIWEYIQ